MNKKKHYFKQLCDFVKLFHFNWKPWFLPASIDIRKDDEKTQKQKRIYNSFFGVLFGIVAVGAALSAIPDIKGMIANFFGVVLLYIAFCFIMNSLKIKANNSGRKPKRKYGSFSELFFSNRDFDCVDNYVISHYSKENQMSTSDCRCLLDIIIEKHLVRDNSMDPMVTLFRKQYPDLLPRYTNRAFTKVKIEPAQKQKMEAELFQNCSKK